MTSSNLMMNSFIKKLSGTYYSNVLNDLVAFTGLDANVLCDHILEANARVRDELKLVAPNGDKELTMFYICCREYLFLNAYRPVWDVMRNIIDSVKSPVLDFAGGMGNDSVWLAGKGYKVDYHEIGIIQREFVRFRVRRNKLENLRVLDPLKTGKFDSMACIGKKYGTMLFRDVLEHVPDYVVLLKKLAGKLLPGGIVIEHSPWNISKGDKPRHSPLHFEEKTPLAKVFADLGFDSVKRHVWRKHV